MANARIIVELIDADGCIYNQKYRDYLVWLFAKYGATFEALNQMRLLAKNNNQPRPALIDESIALIMKDMHEQNLDAFSRKELCELEVIIECSSEKDFEQKMRHYLAQVYLLDQSILNKVFMAANPQLIDRVNSHAGEGVLQYFAVGSNRQSSGFDMQGMRDNLTGSVFKDLFHLAQHLRTSSETKNTGTALMPLTMTDILSGLPRGENYRRIITNPHGEHSSHICDVSKLTLIYAMAHDLAHQHPGERITIHFYDNEDGILDGLYEKLYTKPGSDLLPESVDVVLNQYNGYLGDARIIHGTGSVDKDYHDSVRYMMCLAELTPEFSRNRFADVAKVLHPQEFLDARKTDDNSKTLAVMLDADGCIYNTKYFHLVMKMMKKYGDKIKSMAREIHAEKEARKFRKELRREIEALDIHALDTHEYDELIDDIARCDDCDVSDIDILQDHESYTLHPTVFKIRQALRYLHEIDPAMSDALLYHANQMLFDRIVERANAEKCSRVVFLVGSNRQSVLDDQHCSKTNGTGSFHVDLDRLTGFLNDKYDEKMLFTLDYFLMADVFGDLETGVSFRHSLFNPHDQPHANTVFDETKSSLVYAMLHHIARYYSDIAAVLFFDDRLDIFEAIKHAFGENDEHALLPQGLPLELIHFNGAFSENPVAGVLQGRGDADHGAHHAVKLMAQLAGIDLEEVHRKPSATDIASVVDFKQFAAERRASRPVMDVQFDELTMVRREVVNPRKNIGLFDRAAPRQSSENGISCVAPVFPCP